MCVLPLDSRGLWFLPEEREVEMNLWVRVLLGALVLLVGGLGNRPVMAQGYQLDNSHTSLIFGVSHLGYSYTYGRFNKLEGGFQYDKQKPESAAFEIKIDASSVDTNEPKRDEHLRSPDFFDVKQFPEIVFRSTAIESVKNVNGSQELMVAGEMTMHGVTRKLTLPVTVLGEGPGPYGNYRCGFTTSFRLKRSDFGMKNMVPNIGDTISITFSFEGIQQK